MVESSASISEGRYTYINDTNKGPPEAIDVHHIIIPRSSARSYIFYIFILLLATYWFLLLPRDQSIAFLFSFLLAACLVQSWRGKRVEKESVTILPSFGVQLETAYRSNSKGDILFDSLGFEYPLLTLSSSLPQIEIVKTSGRTVRRFVPISKILKPVLIECVTPVTCYWSLSLIICEEEELLLVFKELHPPVSMLVPIWKALCHVR